MVTIQTFYIPLLTLYGLMPAISQGADIIVISDESNETTMSLDSRLMMAAEHFKKYAEAIACASPQAIIVVASTPVNNLLPIMSQLLVKHGCYNHNKVVGSTLVDTIRASSILASHLNLDPKEVVVPVIGGSSERTRVPVLSQSRPFFSLKKDEKINLINNIRRGDVQVLANKGSPEVLNRVHSTVRFLNSIMAGLRGDPNVTDIALCRTDQVPGVDYFSLPVIFGKDGIVKRYGVPKTTEIEDEMVEEAIKNVKKDTDKAAYIVRGAIELPEQKYLSPNDRASSQKEMFDLYVKCLPTTNRLEKDNKQGSISDQQSEKPTNYSFKNLIKNGPTINPNSIPENKSFHHTVLKSVTSEDSFLKSTGFFQSPLKNPILILEPMECPLAPLDSSKDSALDSEEGALEAEESFILHEKNLAKTGKSDTGHSDDMDGAVVSRDSFCRSPLSSNEMAQMKTVDPIAKLKEQIGNGGTVHTFKTIQQSRRLTHQPIAERNHDNNVRQETTRFETPQQPTVDQTRVTDHEFEEEEMSSHDQTSSAYETERYPRHRTDEKATSFFHDVQSDQLLPVYNIYNRKARSPYPTQDVRDDYQEIADDKSRNNDPHEDEKYKKLVSRLFRNLGGNCGRYLPLKSSNRSQSRCRQSFTESVVRSKSNWAPTGQDFKQKSESMPRLVDSHFHSDNSNCNQMNVQFRKGRKQVPNTIPSFTISPKSSVSRSVSKKGTVLRIQEKDDVSKKEQTITVQVICPKCQNKMSYPPERTTESSSVISLDQIHPCCSEAETKTRKEPEIKKCNVSYYKPTSDTERTHCDNGGKNEESITELPPCDSNAVITLPKTMKETEQKEERLRKLKEKINQKLIPLLNNNFHVTNSAESVLSRRFSCSGLNSTTSNRCTDSIEPCQGNGTKSTGTPFILGSENSSPPKVKLCETKNPGCERRSAVKWQGIPFVVKKNDLKDQDMHNKERILPVDMNANDRKNASSVQTEEEPSKNSQKSKTILSKNPKTTNKLQLLGTSSRNIKASDVDEIVVEKKDSEIAVQDEKKARAKKLSLGLNSEDVQCYMQARIKDNFGRTQQQEITGNNTEEEKIYNDIVESNTNSDKPPERHSNNQITDQSAAVVHTKVQLSIRSSVPKCAESCDSKKCNADSKSSEKDNDVAASSKVEPVNNSGLEREVRVVEMTPRPEEKPKDLSSPPNIDASNHGSENTENSKTNEPIALQSNGMTEKKSSSVIQNTTTSLRNSPESVKCYGNSKPKPLLELIIGKPKALNKLQLLAKARELTSNSSVNGKLQNVWEKTLGGQAPSQCRKSYSKSNEAIHSAETLDKKSAAVKIAQNNYPIKKPTYKMKLKLPKSTNVLEGLTFPPRKIRRRKTNNLLKELAASATQRQSQKIAEMATKKPVQRGRSLDPLGKRCPKDVVKRGTKLSENLKSDQYFSSSNGEYSREVDKLSKLASEVMMNRKLTMPVESKWKSDVTEIKPKKIQKQKRSESASSIRNFRNQWTDYSSGKDSEREARIRKSADDIQSKLISMPQVRHQMEHLELPLGPLEIQPGLAPLNYGKIANTYPSADNSWESVLFNEYVRSNLLPSLKDTRVTFHLEER